MAAKSGNAKVKEFITKVWGGINHQALGEIISKYSPERVVFSGSVAINNQQELLDGLGDLATKTKLSFSEYGDEVSLVGAALWAAKQLEKS